MKKTFFLAAIVFSLILITNVYLVYAQNVANKEASDFALDVAEGEGQVKNDANAQAARQEVLQAEDAQADQGGESVEAREKIEPQEATVDKQELLPEGENQTIAPEEQPDQRDESPGGEAPADGTGEAVPSGE